MALANKIDPDAAAPLLTKTLAGHGIAPGDVCVDEVVVPASAGMSNETLLFRASWNDGGRTHERGLVARVHPEPGAGLFMTYDIERERRLLQALHADGAIPVPRVYFADPDGAALGAPYLVMDRVDGRSPTDDPPFTAAGWVADLQPDQRALLSDRATRVLAAIHSVDWRRLGLEHLNDGVDALGPLDQRLAYERRFYEWAGRGESYRVIDAAFDWLDENRPADEGELVLNWGDARLSNFIFDDTLSVAGVVDWEMASIASPELDLGWWLFGMRHHTEGVGVPLPDGLPTAERFLERYSELTRRAVRDIAFYEVLAGTRGAIMMVRAAQMMIAAGFLPPDTPMAQSNPASQVLARLIDVEQPSGATTSFIGNRAGDPA
jgi:aminoglycoside phosphotransferase (APT) family kinase protein